MELPALWLSVTAQEVADEPSLPDMLSAAADGGATAVVLRDGAYARRLTSQARRQQTTSAVVSGSRLYVVWSFLLGCTR